MPEPRPSYPRDFYSKPIALQDVAFILMPFEGFDDVHGAIRKGVKQARTLRSDLANLEPMRADDLRRKVVLEKILGQIGEAKVVIADLTGRNANVFYELGIAQTLKNNVILLAQDSKDVPADLQPFEYVPYTKSEAGLKKLVVDLAETIRQQDPERATNIQEDWGAPQDMKRHLRQLVTECEQQWLGDTVPSQTEVFEDDFREALAVNQGAERRHAITESMRALHPAFLRPWKPIEDLGFEAIEAGSGRETLLADLLRPLERAYSLSKRSEGPATVVGHGQLLALRTWMLWGAFALERENWKAVDTLLHRHLSFDKPTYSRPERTSFATHKYVFAPDAAGRTQGYGEVELAVPFVLEQSGALAERLSVDVDEARGYLGLWLLATDLAEAATRDDGCVDWPVWPYGPRGEFDRLLPLLDSDPDYAAGFSKAVTKLPPAQLNELWGNGLRANLLDHSRLGLSGWHRMVTRQLPDRFAE